MKINMNKSFDVVELARQLANVVRPGIVVEVDHRQAKVRVQTGKLKTQWLPWLTLRAGNNRNWQPLEVGEQVILLCPCGDPAQAWVLGSGYQENLPALSSDPDKEIYRFSDGAHFEYDRKNHHLKVQLPSGSTTELVSTGGIDFTGDLTVNGNITATQDITDHTRSMQADRDIYNSHKHSGVASGPANTGTTGQQQ
ncbi:phage baseplate assembly protein [Endozoicomonas montiporae CL-33]|nr:phage baseplate assembly protein [Endozoicomonas montiporae CL-33]